MSLPVQKASYTPPSILRKILPSIEKDSSPSIMKIVVKPSTGETTPSKTSSSTPTKTTVNEPWVPVSFQQRMPDLCFKFDHLQQLSTNALPAYTPRLPPNFTSNDVAFEFRCCTDCGDTFALSTSLEFHLQRRSVKIKLPCQACDCDRTFYNRCTLLSHVRAHGDKGEVSDISRAIVSPLPRSLMDGFQNEPDNQEDEDNAEQDVDATPPTEMLECSLKEMDEENPRVESAAVTVTVPTVVGLSKVRCLDCNLEFGSREEREKHLTNEERIPTVPTQCNKCNMVCPSRCALKAHQRVHLQVSPYVCPECGDSPDPHWTNFLMHVNDRCFHNSRNIGYSCPVCKHLMSSTAALLKHMDNHTENYIKCESCPRAYMTMTAFNSHIETYHESKKVPFKIIYKCSLCDIVFLNKEQMMSHRSTHLKEHQVRSYIFNCMQCGKSMQSKVQLLEHIRSYHPKAYKVCLSLDNKPEEPPPASHLNTQYRGKVQCLLCHCIFHSYVGYNQHLNRAHIHLNFPCTSCFMIIANRKAMLAHGQSHMNSGNLVCLLCNNKKFGISMQLDVHLAKHVERLRFTTFCPICNHMCATQEEAYDHLRKDHRLESEPKKTGMNVTCHLCRGRFANDAILKDHMKTRHNYDTSNKRAASPPSSISDPLSDAPPPPKAIRLGNSCAKCDFRSKDREEFKTHILTHKISKSTFQCKDCGLCFVVKPSLEKHLKIVHKIRDSNKYMEEEGTNFVSETENAREVSDMDALICSVCFTSFSSEASLKTHMRSHGMAFIQAKKAVVAI